ncbi:unnamed protein product [Sphagnum balticum]
MNGKLSLFSIINDNTSGPQYKDQDIIHGFKRDFNKSKLIRFDLLSKSRFTVVHSQCEVSYNIEGFKLKNQDKLVFARARGKGNREAARVILEEVRARQGEYLMGTRRVYLRRELEERLNGELYNFFKVKSEKVVLIQRAFRKHRFRRLMLVRLKRLVQRK